jgi:hypothetical protein
MIPNYLYSVSQILLENMLSNYKHISVQLASIDSAEKDESTDQFALKDNAGKEWQGKKLILANGVEDMLARTWASRLGWRSRGSWNYFSSTPWIDAWPTSYEENIVRII